MPERHIEEAGSRGARAGALERILPYGREPLFDLAADVERYPEFMPL